MSAQAEVQAETIKKYLEGWTQRNAERYLASLSEDFTHATLPDSGKPPQTRAELERQLPILMETLTDFEARIHNVILDSLHNKAVVYATTKATTPFGPYNNAQAIFMWFDESGQINKVKEMLDTAFMNDFTVRFSEYMAQKKQKEARRA